MSIQSSLQYGILRLTIDRKERRNALTADMFRALADALRAAEADPKTRVVLLQAAGSVFSAGADLEEMLAAPEAAEAAADDFFSTISAFTKPVIAAVNGPCVGEAFTALLYCDLVYAGSHALFSLPAVALARTPRWGAATVMALAAGPSKAAEKLLLSEPISADEAEAMRLITRVVEDEHLENVVAAKTARLAVLPPSAVAGTKQVLRAARAKLLADAAPFEEEVYRRQAVSPEAAEALKAFLEGRRPVFQADDEE
ncbi:enoyl-CoA hydratase-related protein [Sutterella sp.]|uniref:enoyl-CoA hydratase-related protein n=1 Tax=Sutterella sp. TaxID=1981025 RepID=UPI003FD739F6